MTHNFDIARIEVVGVERSIREVPHDLRCRPRIVNIDQRERQAGDVIFEIAIRAESHLGRIAFRSSFVGRWPFKMTGRDDLQQHRLSPMRLSAKSFWK